jgi:hypothetical protein
MLTLTPETTPFAVAWLSVEHWNSTAGTADLDRYFRLGFEMWKDGVARGVTREVRAEDILATVRAAGCRYPTEHQMDDFRRYIDRLNGILEFLDAHRRGVWHID